MGRKTSWKVEVKTNEKLALYIQMNVCKILAQSSNLDMKALALNKHLQKLSGVAVSDTDESLQLVRNTGLTVVPGGK